MAGTSLPLPFSKLAPVGLCPGILRKDSPPPQWIVDKFNELLQSPPKMMLMLGNSNTEENESAIDLLKRIAHSKFNVVLVVPNSHLKTLAEPRHAEEWVNRYVIPYKHIVTHICVGDLSMLGSDQIPQINLLNKAINTIRQKIKNQTVPITIKVSTMLDVNMLGTSNNPDDLTPYTANTAPSNCRFRDIYKGPLMETLKENSIPLFAKIFPYKYEFGNIKPSNYLMNNDAEDYMTDPGPGGCSYKYVYDAMLDSIYCALDNLWGSPCNAPVWVVTGWPSQGNVLNTQYYQKTYLGNLCTHVDGGTPRKPGTFIHNYVYWLVDSDSDPRCEPNQLKHLGIVTYPKPLNKK